MTEASRLPPPLERPEETFSGRAVDVLREMVLSGQLRAGERINEVTLAKALGISRGPLREAIQRLRSEGVVTSVSGRGAFVRTFGRQELTELYEVRIALESHAVRLIVHNPDTGEGLEELRSMLAQTDQSVADTHVYPRELDFHHRLLAIPHNQALVDAATDVLRKIVLARSRSGHVSTRAVEALADHHRILELLAAGDAEGAVEVLDAHLRRSLASALEVFETERARSVPDGL